MSETINPSFSFPFQPYEIQKKFMSELYLTIENRKCGIFESPTGTGKSLSICCGALQWLKDSNQKILEDLTKEISQIKLELSSKADTDDWLQEEYNKIKKNQILVNLQLKFNSITQREKEFDELKKKINKQKLSVSKNEHFFKKREKDNESNNDNISEEKENIDDQDLIIEESEIREDDSDNEEINLDANEENITKIYISSRTHSQLSQFVGEIKRTIFKDSTRVITLASRQHYCINSDVNKLKNANLINERCLDMQKSKTKSTSIAEEGKVLKKTKTKSCSACPYYNQNNITKLKDQLLVEIMDMEDIIKCGKQLKACPYYASRMALDESEVVLISHAGIVSSGARSGISLKLKDNVLILDEAHGLTAALENANSAPVSYKQLGSVKTFLEFYINKYRSRFSSKSLLQLNQVSFIVGKLLGLIKPKSTNDKKQQSTIFTLEDFVIKSEIDHMNIRPLVDFCRNTRLAPKLHGFSIRYSQQGLEEEIKKEPINKKANFKEFLSNISKKKDEHEQLVNAPKLDIKSNNQISTETSAGSGLYAVLDFLERLCDRSDNGRVLAQVGETGHLKYLLLNPAEHFEQVVSQCRSVILAGGTMEPMNEFQALLTNNLLNTEIVNIVKCEHVVAPENVLGVCLSKGPSNISLNFSYENRTSKELLNEVGRILRNVCSIVPDGVVCFLPSYSYEQTLYDHLNCSKVIEIISKKKKIFREPKSASEVDEVLQKYALAINGKGTGTGTQNGALLFSVVGGKLSEGLNFSDNLGRCVIVIGMPYPNIKSPELQEKMSYMNKKNPGAGSIYYENLCMKAVNQCIGRAVRHANDFACVLLVDERYSRPQTVSALPSFVQKSLISNCTFGQTMGSVAKFFARHKEKK
ncbi:ATP-dependent DNA helicase DDX11 [Vanessa cardui]|uniref:ATP-dependent DNA helicase DDX11 n=1 Tax=Vanessa cardui TaxID=171605 RepID=UPI001F149487|nr:ATP-dependent DNA helicase DDX11 [Vanessa cardui]XP_046963241.1 ATP-dependent DNA helicase DDX11 [Vanessa cardui]